MYRAAIACLLLCVITPITSAAEVTPDPATVQHEGPAYRYPQAGWIVVHVEGEPYQRGQQQGKLLWREIQNYVKCFATEQCKEAPEQSWPMMRTMADALFLRRFDPEFLEEMKGIADGAAVSGARFAGRPIDLTDIVAINVWPEMIGLQRALTAQPTGLEGKDFDKLASEAPPSTQLSRCSAFAATGPATRDGKAIIGHITMFELYPCNFFNVWLDVKPAKGHRLVFQAAPGSIQSGMDWYINDVGIVLTETTISQTKYNPDGLSIGSRSRRSMQYGDSIDSVVKILGDGGNGLYTNEWLLADMKTNEIALFELGTNTTRLMRSSKSEWFGNTPGFYWGNNNTKDLAVRMETIASTNDRPVDITFRPQDRDIAWVQLYQQYKGKMDADFGKIAFSKPPLVTRNSVDAKFTNADMALQLKSNAHWGDPYGQLWEPSPDELRDFPDTIPIVPNDWTTLTTAAPATQPSDALAAVDLKGDEDGGDDHPKHENHPLPPPAWHGTLLPATDGDIWLTSAFARFQDYVAREHQLLKTHAKKKNGKIEKNLATANELPSDPDSINLMSQSDRDKQALSLFRYREATMSQGMDHQPVPLRAIKSDVADDKWFRSASGRGVMLLSELRRRLGSERFDAAMESFGRAHAGQTVDSQSFITAINAVAGSNLNDFFTQWLDKTDALPTLELSSVASEKQGDKYTVSGKIASRGGFTPLNVDITVETEDGETTTPVAFTANSADFHLPSDEKPTRVVVNKYGRTPCTNGWNWSASSWFRNLDQVLIVYGTRAQATGNRIAAEKLQDAIIDEWEHLVVPIKPDTSVTDDDLRSHHILLIGRPDCSELIERLSPTLPVAFRPHSFTALGKLYANADSAVIAAAPNPLNASYSIVCIAGLDPSATLRAAESLTQDAPAPLKIMAADQSPKNIAPPAPELSQELK